jgi:carbon-monoxide dehydrogenase small subunit
MRVELRVNGRDHQVDVEPRRLLADVLRDDLGLTGTTIGCGHGVCGSCTVLVDGQSRRSCLTLAVQCDGQEISTVEGLAAPGAPLHPLQQAFHEQHALQCGFCTPGFLMLLAGALAEDPDLDADPERLTAVLSSNLCRCTGYLGIQQAARSAAAVLREQRTTSGATSTPATDDPGESPPPSGPGR